MKIKRDKAKDIHWTVSRETGYFKKYDKAFSRTLKPKCSLSRETEHFEVIASDRRELGNLNKHGVLREAVGRPKNLWVYRSTVNGQRSTVNEANA